MADQMEKEKINKHPFIIIDGVTFWYDPDFSWEEKKWYGKPAIDFFENIQEGNLIIFNYKEGDLFKYHYESLRGSCGACLSKPYLIVGQSKKIFKYVPIIEAERN